MRPFISIVAALTVLGALPVDAAVHHRSSYYNGRHHYSYAQCRADKRRAGHRGTVIGAVGGGAGTALLGGGVGGALLGAGVGAVAGNVIGRNGHRGC